MLVRRSAVFTLLTPLHQGTERSRIKPENLPDGVGNNYSPHNKMPTALQFANQRVITDVPVISGNSIRSKMRELLVVPTLNALGLDLKTINKNIREILVSGGGMDSSNKNKNAKESEKEGVSKNVPLLVRDRETLRAVIPIISLFGASYGNRMVHSSTKIGYAYPSFKENDFILNRNSDLSYSSEILSYQLGTRMKDQYDEDESSGESRQSIYYHEVVAPGIDFVHTLTLINTSKLERSAFQLAIELFREEPFVGGKSATGHGEISTNEWYEDLDVPSSYYLDWLKENKDVILEYLDAWERPNKLVRVKKGGEELVWNEPLAKELDRLVQEREADIRSSRGV